MLFLLKNNTQTYLRSYKLYSKIKGSTSLNKLGTAYYYATTLKLGQMKQRIALCYNFKTWTN